MMNTTGDNTTDVQATLRGWLVRDPEVRTNSAGKEYAMAALAVGVQSGSDPEFITVFVSAERGIKRLMQLKKGDRLFAAGSLRRNEYSNKQSV